MKVTTKGFACFAIVPDGKAAVSKTYWVDASGDFSTFQGRPDQLPPAGFSLLSGTQKGYLFTVDVIEKRGP